MDVCDSVYDHGSYIAYTVVVNCLRVKTLIITCLGHRGGVNCHRAGCTEYPTHLISYSYIILFL